MRDDGTERMAPPHALLTLRVLSQRSDLSSVVVSSLQRKAPPRLNVLHIALNNFKDLAHAFTMGTSHNQLGASFGSGSIQVHGWHA